MSARIVLHVVIRTKFYDDYLLAAASEGVRQVALLAAGLDARAFRLPWPAGTTVYEVDLPEMLAFKDEVLGRVEGEPSCTRVPVAADLTGDWAAALAEAGFDPDMPTAWLVEGLLVYLSPDDAGRLLETIGVLSGAGSRLSCEQGRSAMQLAAQSAEAGASEATKLWQGGIEDIVGWLADHGWTVDTHELATLAAGYGRPINAETNTGFVIARR